MYELDDKKYLYLLIAIPVLAAIFLFNLYWKRKKQKEFGDLEMVRKLSPEKSTFKATLKFSIFMLALACLIIGLVNPKIGTKTETVKREGIDIVFAVDVSKSMLAEDVAPNRLEKSKQVISQLINQMAGDRIGIVAYAGSAFPVLPITTDYASAKMFLQGADTDIVSSQGTALGEAITLASTYFDDDKQTSKLIILVSDGEDHGDGAQDAAEEAKKLGIKIITIGIGTEKGGPIPLKEGNRVLGFKRDKNDEVVVTKRNAESLKMLSKNSKGYVDGNITKDVVDYVKKSLDTIERSELETQQFTDFNSQFQWFIGIAFVLLAIDVFLLEKKTKWIRKMNLFNEKES
ncbi:MAG: VWA domain-containing protein [Flavobacterium sp.]|uniref:vWA domain-containing protein n=1 Tax=Flavobacterium sp. TaxID=239 RepID=UPI00121A392D|nr:VWA domain-containing protein [Flavobacterium sp.]RZJ68112.1 MAG: VWA domain-containing protein [Flavobacterium sp.]